jgi:steroid delta-isomerase-like uncharacterized protein
MSSTAPSPMTSSQAMIDAAKASILAYNDKNWDNVRASLTPDALYDEVATQRKLQGVDQVIECWEGWARALPDSKATIHGAMASGNTVCIEMTWHGKHTGPLELPTGPLAATNRSIEVRACQVFDMSGTKARTIRHYFDMSTLLQQLGVMESTDIAD